MDTCANVRARALRIYTLLRNALASHLISSPLHLCLCESHMHKSHHIILTHNRSLWRSHCYFTLRFPLLVVDNSSTRFSPSVARLYARVNRFRGGNRDAKLVYPIFRLKVRERVGSEFAEANWWTLRECARAVFIWPRFRMLAKWMQLTKKYSDCSTFWNISEFEF